MSRFALIGGLVSVAFTVGVVHASSNCYIRVATASNTDSIVSSLEARGIHVLHVLPPNEFIAEAPLSAARLLRHIEAVHVQHVEERGGVDHSTEASLQGERIFELLTGKEDILNYAPGPVDSTPYCGKHTLYAEDAFAKRPRDFLFPDPTEMFNANYLVGSVSIGLFLMESDGSERNWTEAQQDSAIAAMFKACELLNKHSEPYNIDIRWYYHIYRSVPTGEEPIQTDYPNRNIWGWHFGWINDAMDLVGFAHEWDGTHRFANWLRATDHTDWGFEMFVVKNNPNETFPTGMFGYHIDYSAGLNHYLYNGAFAVATYNYYGGSKAAYGLFAHESAHVFGASDEYDPAAGCDDGDDCDDLWGYLNYQNVNCEHCGPAAPCLMRWPDGNQYFMCGATSRHLGWTDSDDDGNADAIDPNSTWWATLHHVNPGDLVRVFTLNGDFVNAISVTDQKMERVSSGNTILWDCMNYDDQEVTPGMYYYTINEGPPQTLSMFHRDLGILPAVSNVSFSQDSLRWELENSFCYLTLTIKAYHRVYHDTFLVAQPQRNQFHLASTDTPNKKQPLTDIYCNPCVAEFKTWRPDGGNGTPLTFQFATYVCGDWTDNGITDGGDLGSLVSYLTGGFGTPDPLIVKDVDCSGRIDGGDLSVLVSYLTGGGAQLNCCY